MATINGYTAERMKEIEDAAVISGTIVGDNLILTRFDATEINAGNVRGETGLPGLTEEELAIQMAIFDPPGIPKPYTGPTAPIGYGLCDAATEYNGVTYPSLASLYGTGPECINGASTAGTFRLPNLKGKVLVGRDSAVSVFDTLHETGGSKDTVVPTHSHGISNDGTHTHSVDGGNFGDSIVVNYASPSGIYVSSTPAGYDVVMTHIDDSGNHGHGGATGASGVSEIDKNLPPYRVVNYIMRLA